jgi:ATP-binding protein involved in chromosome partitioning
MSLFSKKTPPPGNGSPAEATVLDALRRVEDPDMHRDIVALRFVKSVAIDGTAVRVGLELTTPACPYKDRIRDDAVAALRAIPGVTDARVDITATVLAAQPLLAKQAIEGVKNVVAVSSGKGGVGKTTVAVNLACSLAQSGARVGILDADVYGPNVPLMVGASGQPDTRGQKIVPFERYGVHVMSMGLLVKEDQPVIWRGPMLHGAIRQFLFDVLWDNLDYLVVDLPPGTGDAQLSLSQTAHLVGTVIVTTPQEVSVLDVKKAIAMFQQVNVPILGVVENMAGLAITGRVVGAAAGTSVRVQGPEGEIECRTDARGEFQTVMDVFGTGGAEKLQAKYGIPLLGRIPLEPRVRIGGDTGKPVTVATPDSPVARAFRDMAGQVAARISTINLSAQMDV